MGATTRAAPRRLGSNIDVIRVGVAHLLAVLAEWAAIVGVLVYAFEQGGARATGLTSLAILAPAIIGAPVAAWLTNTHRPLTVRRVGLAVQAVAYSAAGAAAYESLPVVVVAGCAVIALIAASALRPTGAVLLPAFVRSSRELAAANLAMTYCDNVSALLGPLAAAALLAVGGPAAALWGCAGATAIAVLIATVGAGTGPPASPRASAEGRHRLFDGAFATLRRRADSRALTAIVGVRYALVGAFDIMLVILAFDVLELGRSGTGLLSALFGGGALISAAFATVAVRRASLAPAVMIALVAAAAACFVLAGRPTLVLAALLLPLAGMSASLIDGAARMLLQRSAHPKDLGSIFALVELTGGVGLVAGSGLAQLLVALGDVRLALAGIGTLFIVTVVVTARWVRRADALADVPVVEMSLLRQLPMFAALAPLTLEAVARNAEHVIVPAGGIVIEQGAPGDRFYAVADGAFDVVMSGRLMRVANRGDCFGEVALLASVPRTATVSANGVGTLLAVDRVAFLTAVTGADTSLAAAWGVVRAMELDTDVPTHDIERAR